MTVCQLWSANLFSFFSQPHLNMGAIVHTPGSVGFAEVLFFLPKV